MAFNESLAIRIRTALRIFPEEFTEKKMFGGLSFLYKGKMTVGIVKDKLAVRVIASKVDELLNSEHVHPMDFTKRPMKEFVFVHPDGFTTEEALHHYIELGVEHAKTKLNEI